MRSHVRTTQQDTRSLASFADLPRHSCCQAHTGDAWSTADIKESSEKAWKLKSVSNAATYFLLSGDARRLVFKGTWGPVPTIYLQIIVLSARVGTCALGDNVFSAEEVLEQKLSRATWAVKTVTHSNVITRAGGKFSVHSFRPKPNSGCQPEHKHCLNPCQGGLWSQP